MITGVRFLWIHSSPELMETSTTGSESTRDEDACSIDSGVSLPAEKECHFPVRVKAANVPTNAIDEHQPHSLVIHNRVVSLKESLGSSFFTSSHVASTSFTPVSNASSCNGEDNSTSDYESTCSDSSFNIRPLLTSPRVLSPDCHVTPVAVFQKVDTIFQEYMDFHCM